MVANGRRRRFHFGYSRAEGCRNPSLQKPPGCHGAFLFEEVIKGQVTLVGSRSLPIPPRDIPQDFLLFRAESAWSLKEGISGAHFVRMASPEHHREAVTSRPLLLNTIGQLTHHAGRRFLTITNVHAKAAMVTKIFRNLAQFLGQFRLTAEQLAPPERWNRLLRLIFAKQFSGVILRLP